MEINREDRACSGGAGRRKQGSEQLLQNKGRTNVALGRENTWGVDVPAADSEQKMHAYQPAQWYFAMVCSMAVRPLS